MLLQMSEIFQLRDLLLNELYVAVRTTKQMLLTIDPNEWSYRPNDGMRTLLEVVHHLVLVPSTDLAILQEMSDQEVHKIDEDVRLVTDPAELGNLMEQGFQELKHYFSSLDETGFMNKETKPFYSDHYNSQAKWLVEIVTHAHHHRAQLFNYLKQLGHSLNMFNLY